MTLWSARKTWIALLAAATLVPAVRAQEEPPADSPPTPSAERSSRLQGSAYLDRNVDVVGGTVVVQPMQDPAVLYLTSTNATGRFKIDGLPDGEYRVRIERHGVVPISKDAVQVRFPFRAVVELDMEPAQNAVLAAARGEPGSQEVSGNVRLAGTIRDQELAPLAEARLRLVHADGRVDPVMATSAEDGTFAIDAIPAGTWQLTIHGIGTLPVRTTVTLVGDTTLGATLVRQPATYQPSPLDLMPPEEPIPPDRLGSLRLGT